jgi:hypothetical protein
MAVKVYTRIAARQSGSVAYQEPTPTMSLSTLLVVAGAILALVVVAVAILAFRSPASLQRWMLTLFRRPDPPARTAGDEQYYRPYWSH